MTPFEWLIAIAVFAMLGGAGVCAGFGVQALWRRFRGRNEPRAGQQLHARDMANMMILFQTMRDMLDEQKELARQLNDSFDEKIAKMDRMMSDARDELEAVKEATGQLALQTAETREDLLSIQRQTGYIRDGDRPRGSHPDEAIEPNQTEASADTESAGDGSLLGRDEAAGSPEAEDAEAESVRPNGDPSAPAGEDGKDQGLARPPLQLLKRPEASSASPGAEEEEREPESEYWVGLDFGGDTPNPQDFDVPGEPPGEPADAEAARDAFRALLNMSQREGNAFGQADSDGSAADEGRSAGHGGAGSNAIKARVCEYNDAGMPVAQIASELGIGKGEVRLILSLRDNGGS